MPIKKYLTCEQAIKALEKRTLKLEQSVFKSPTHICPICHDGKLHLEHGIPDTCIKCGSECTMWGASIEVTTDHFMAHEYEVKHG